jgi:hypothetical protein
VPEESIIHDSIIALNVVHCVIMCLKYASFCEFAFSGDSHFAQLIFFNSHSGEWSPNWVHSARRPFTGLLYLPRVIVRMENLVE